MGHLLEVKYLFLTGKGQFKILYKRLKCLFVFGKNESFLNRIRISVIFDR